MFLLLITRKSQSSYLRHVFYSTFIVASFIVSCALTLARSPYDVLGVSKQASPEQIKKSYRDLARKLHPDKSNLSESESESKFIELNKAFNLLKDPERRKRYDQSGDTNDTPRQQRRHSNMAFGQRGFQSFTFHDGHSTFEFKFDSTSSNVLKKNSITARQYYQHFLSLSKKKVHYIFLYSEFCQPCDLIEPTWTKLSSELEKFGVGFLTLNVYQQPQLARDIGATSIPYIVSLVDEKIKHYHYNDISLANLIEFTKNIMPSNLIVQLNDASIQDRFISSGPQKNRLSLLIINNESHMKLRYLLLALEFRDRYQFGHVSTRISQHKLMKDKYKISNDNPTILIFDEDYHRPIHRLQTTKNQEFHRDEIRELLLKQQYLQLPRITSQGILEDLCVDLSDNTQIQRKLCVILIASNIPKDESSRTMLRKFIKFHEFHQDKSLAFAYIDANKQSDFVSSLLEEPESLPSESLKTEPLYSVFIIRKLFHEDKRVKYRWLAHKWDPSNLDEFDRAKMELLEILNSFKKDNIDLPFRAALRPIVDEEGPSLLWRVRRKLVDTVERLYYWVTKSDGLHVLILITITVIMLTYYIIRFFCVEVGSYNEFKKSCSSKYDMHDDISRRKQETQFDANNTTTRSHDADNDIKLIELKAETYNGLIRLLKPGCRSIILLCDPDSGQKLLPLFMSIVRPYRRNKSLLFGYLKLEKNLAWYESLLSQAVGSSDIQINSKNCIGTVLSLNGYRKYFCVYHLKHIEPTPYEDEDGSFLGFDHVAPVSQAAHIRSTDSATDDFYQGDTDKVKFFADETGTSSSGGRQSDEEDEDETNRTTKSNRCAPTMDANRLLDNLPNWLDKMFDGITRRYHIDYWPDNLR